MIRSTCPEFACPEFACPEFTSPESTRLEYIAKSKGRRVEVLISELKISLSSLFFQRLVLSLPVLSLPALSLSKCRSVEVSKYLYCSCRSFYVDKIDQIDYYCKYNIKLTPLVYG